MISRTKTKQRRIVTTIHHADTHPRMMAAEAETRQTAVAVKTMEGTTVTEREVEDVMTQMKNGRDMVTEGENRSDGKVCHVQRQEGDIAVRKRRSLPEDATVTQARQLTDTPVVASTVNESMLPNTTARPV